MEKKLPKGWVETEFGNYISLKNGYAYKSTQFTDSGIPILKISNITKDGKVDISNPQFVSKKNLNKSFLVEDGDIVIAMSGATTGKFGIYEGNELLLQNQRVGNIKLLSKSLGNKRFVYYLTASLKKEIEEKAYGGAQPNISPTLIESIRIPLPPLAEQKRIVAKLDALFAQHEVMKKALEPIPQLLKDFRQQILTQAVTGKLTEQWREGKKLINCINTIKDNRSKFYKEKLQKSKNEGSKKPKKLTEDDFEHYEFNKKVCFPEYWKLENLKNICDLITDGEHSTPVRTEEGFYLLSARNVRDGYLSVSNVDYVGESEFNRLYQRCNPEFKDLLISCSGSVGRVTQFPENVKAVMVRSAALLKIQSNKEISKFIEYVLRSDIGQYQIERLKKSTAQANLFLEPIGKIVTPLASYEEQQEIVSRVESLFAKADAIEARYTRLKEKITSLPQALLHKAFQGELVPQLPTDGDAKDLLAEIMALKKEVKVKKK